MAIWTNGGTLVIDGSGKVITCATCPCATVDCTTTCCLDGALTPTVEVNLGATPLTDEDCGACDTVAGAFELTNTDTCTWTGEFDYECGSTEVLDCSAPAPDEDYNGFRLIIVATLSTTNCRWSVSISGEFLMDGVIVGVSDQCPGFGDAQYIGTNNDIHCDGRTTNLSKSSSSLGGTACVDNMPATITIRVV